MYPNLTAPDTEFEVLQLDMLDPWHQFLMNHRRFKRLLGDPIGAEDSIYSYQTGKSQFSWFNPSEQGHVKLLKPNSFGEEIVVHSVFCSLPAHKRTNNNKRVLFDCCYRSSFDFAQIAQKYSAPHSPVPRMDLIFDLGTDPDQPWGYLL